jgi:carboxyl-terminal processing protease
MPRFIDGARITVPLFILSSLLLGAAPHPTLSAPLASDVRESYRLLTSSAYRPVDQNALLRAAQTALQREAKARGVSVALPPVRAGRDVDATMAQLDDAIATSAESAHAPATDFTYAAINAMANSVGDRYTQFFTPDQFRRFNAALDPEQITGIGVIMEADAASKAIRLSYVVPETPADRAGLQAGDLVTAIEGNSTTGMTVDAASKLMRGKAGTPVNVSVTRDGTAQNYSIRRAEVRPPTVVFKMLPGDVGYVYVMAFGKATPAEFDTAIGRLKEQGARALVLDLRNDGGGYVDSALLISRRFIANKALLTVEERGNHATTIDADNETSVELPVSVLVNQYTASASEITAGALQDDGVGMLVGTKTYGKGVMQTLTPLADGAAIKITTAHYLTPRRRDINLRGIEPDLMVDENEHAIFGEIGRDAQLRAALALLQKKTAAVSN